LENAESTAGALAEGLAKLSHLIYCVCGMGRCDWAIPEFVYLVMEYAEENLSQILATARTDARRAQELLIQ